jgi:hypothetical protein
MSVEARFLVLNDRNGTLRRRRHMHPAGCLERGIEQLQSLSTHPPRPNPVAWQVILRGSADVVGRIL